MTPRKTVLITGGSRGIGAAIVRLFAARGWRIAFTWVSKTVPAVDGVSVYCCDVRDEAQIAGLFRSVVADFGRTDALVNNAGITGPRRSLGP
jgi:NAD(P)-dependent dehydrogenase (short-subunit alcohol dehydrogenase family)